MVREPKVTLFLYNTPRHSWNSFSIIDNKPHSLKDRPTNGDSTNVFPVSTRLTFIPSVNVA